MEPYPIYLFNTLKKEKEVFNPIKKGHVSMYHCGPTVYNFAHIGNLRAYVAADILRRVFEFNNYTVTQVMNITDIGHLQSDADDGDDKMTLALRRENLPFTLEAMRTVANRFYDAFRADLEELNIRPANYYPFASDHIEDDILFIKNLLENGHAYATDDGIYFDTDSIRDYGKLGGVSSGEAGDKVESRLSSAGGLDDSEVREGGFAKIPKRNFRDFAVWKLNSELGYDAEFGKGFPGWHIECSVMSMKYLGDTFDIHTGGTDHISVHHNNEIAQSEAKSGRLLANYWLHNEHLIIDGGKKMAKSGESFITLDSVVNHHISPMGFRYWVLGASYRSQLQFSFEALLQAEQGYQNLIDKIALIIRQENEIEGSDDVADGTEGFEHIDDSVQEAVHIDHWTENFTQAINNDLDTASGLALFHTMLKNPELEPSTKIKLIESFDQVFGLELIMIATEKAKIIEAAENTPIPEEIRELAEKRLLARQEKNWAESDHIRDQIKMKGFEIKDEENSYTISKII